LNFYCQGLTARYKIKTPADAKSHKQAQYLLLALGIAATEVAKFIANPEKPPHYKA
jgi:hypothetical protein